MNLSFQKLFFVIATIFAIFAVLVLAKPILIPLSIALLLSFILYPLSKQFESWRMNKVLAAFLSILVVFLIIYGVVYFFSTQIIDLSKQFTNFQDKIIGAFAEVTLYINNNVTFVHNLEKNELIDRLKEWLNESTGALVKKTFSSTTTFITGLIVTTIFTFLILIYRKGLVKAFSGFSPEDKRERVVKMYKSVQQVGQKYLIGIILLTTIVGLVNSFGLMIIGIDNPFLFGFLSAILGIIPYIGTILGAIIPVIYTFVSYDPWMALAVAALFWLVQLISDNFLTPKIVGGSLAINALTTILSLITGAIVWGIAGMILFLPFVAMLKVVCEEYEELKPVALLIGSENYKEKDGHNKFISKWSAKIHDWISVFHFSKKKHKRKTDK